MRDTFLRATTGIEVVLLAGTVPLNVKATQPPRLRSSVSDFRQAEGWSLVLGGDVHRITQTFGAQNRCGLWRREIPAHDRHVRVMLVRPHLSQGRGEQGQEAEPRRTHLNGYNKLLFIS